MGAQTQRSLQNFKIGQERLPRAMIRAMGLVKNLQPSPMQAWANYLKIYLLILLMRQMM